MDGILRVEAAVRDDLGLPDDGSLHDHADGSPHYVINFG
jgi:hypothetical protein